MSDHYVSDQDYDFGWIYRTPEMTDYSQIRRGRLSTFGWRASEVGMGVLLAVLVICAVTLIVTFSAWTLAGLLYLGMAAVFARNLKNLHAYTWHARLDK